MSQVEVGEIVGTAKELGVPAAGADRAVREPRPRTIYGGPVVADGGAADRAVAGGQPDRSVGGDPARNVDHGGDGRRGGSLVRLCCRTASAGVPPAASARSLIAGQRNLPRAHDPRLGEDGKRVWTRVGLLMDVLGRMEVWLAHHGHNWLTAQDRSILAPRFQRPGTRRRIGSGPEPGLRQQTAG